MAIQGSTIHLGNLGEHVVAGVLARHAIVRWSAQGRDIGVDLYCEGVQVGNEPSGSLPALNHFWVQIKSTEKMDGRPRISRQEINSWLSEPVPVFVFCVEIPGSYLSKDQQGDGKPTVHVYDLNLWSLSQQGQDFFHDSNDSVTLSPTPFSENDEYKWYLRLEAAGLSKCDDYYSLTVKEFVEGHVAYSYGVHSIRRGIVRLNPDKHLIGSDESYLVGGFTPLFINIILARIAETCGVLAHDHSEDEDRQVRIRRYAETVNRLTDELLQGLGIDSADAREDLRQVDRG